MEQHHGGPFAALMSTVVSIWNAGLAFISMQQAQTGLAIIASCIAMASGGLAARYYWYATKEKKETLKNLKRDNERI